MTLTATLRRPLEQIETSLSRPTGRLGVAVGHVGEPDGLERRHGLLSRRPRRHAAELQGEHHVLDRAQHGDEVQALLESFESSPPLKSL